MRFTRDNYSIIARGWEVPCVFYSQTTMKRILSTIAFIALTFLAVLAFFTEYQVATCPLIFLAIVFAGIASSKEESHETGR